MLDTPVRYVIGHVQAAALFELVGVVPDGRLIDRTEPVTHPADVLRDTDFLDAAGTRPVPVLDAALRIVAAPSRILTVRISVPGIDQWSLTRVAAGPTGGPYVVVATPADGLDLIVLSSELEVAALLDGFLDLSTLPIRPVSPDVVLSFAAWVGMLAAVDVRRRAALRATLDRRPLTDGAFDAADLSAQLEGGLAANDTDWAITAFTPLSPVDLRGGPPTGQAMTRAMEEAGLVEIDGEQCVFTELGADLAELFGSVIKWGSVTLTSAGLNPDVRMGELSVLRAAFRLGLGFWNGETAGFEATLVEPEADAAVEMVRRMLLLPLPPSIPVPTAQTCPGCGAVVADGQRFCVECGQDLQAGGVTPIVACPACGADFDPEFGRFCAACGAAVVSPPDRGVS
jgi:hypothetical protein